MGKTSSKNIVNLEQEINQFIEKFNESDIEYEIENIQNNQIDLLGIILIIQ